MTTQTKTMTPIEYVEAAEREYAAGNDRESARLLADATDALFDMLAESARIRPVRPPRHGHSYGQTGRPPVLLQR